MTDRKIRKAKRKGSVSRSAVRKAVQKVKQDKPLKQELAALLNKHSKENGSDTPDYILADYLLGCLEVFERTMREREGWYGREISNSTD